MWLYKLLHLLTAQHCIILCLCFAILTSSVSVKAEQFNAPIISHTETLLYEWFGSDSNSTKNIESFKKALSGLRNNKKEYTSYTLGELYIALFEYNLEQYQALLPSLQVNSLYIDRAKLLHDMITVNQSYPLSEYLNKESSFNDIDYLLLGNYFLQKGDLNKAQQLYTEGLKRSVVLRKSFDILLGVVDLVRKGDSSLFVHHKNKKIPFISMLPYLRPLDIYYFLITEFLPANYSLEIIASDKLDIDTIQNNLSVNKFTLSYTNSFAYCTMYDILNCFTNIMIISGKFTAKPSTTFTYLPDNIKDTATLLVDSNILPLYLDGKIPLYTPISGAFFKKLYALYIEKFGKPNIAAQSSMFKPLMTDISMYSYMWNFTHYTMQSTVWCDYDFPFPK